jgi:hypothetical protein
MVQYGLSNVFYIENDVMVYADFGQMLPLFQERYPGIGVPDSSAFFYIAKQTALQQFCLCLLSYAARGYDTAPILDFFKKQNGVEVVDLLPTSASLNHLDAFQSLFESATSIEWQQDDHGRPIPYTTIGTTPYRLNTLRLQIDSTLP